MTTRQRRTEMVLDALFALVVGLTLAFCMMSCAPAVYSDPGPFAFEAEDNTALLAGCGNGAVVGHLYCQFPVDWEPTGAVTVMVPPTDCPAESCASVTIWSSELAKIVTRDVPKGQSYVTIPWAHLVGPGPVLAHLRGFWPVMVKWSWSDPASGVILQAMAEGEIRLRIHAANYTPLAYDPAEATWSWSLGGRDFTATDKGRTSIKGTHGRPPAVPAKP